MHDDPPVLLDRLARPVHEVQEHRAALDVPEEGVAEAPALVRALDQAGDVGEHQLRPVHRHHAEPGCRVVKG